MASTGIVGSTGLVGSHILSTLLALPSVSSVHSVSRRAPTSTDPKLHPIVSTESSQWATQFSAVSPAPAVFFSGLGTTRGAAGSVEAQRLIEYDLNLDLAKAAKTAGVKTYVLISSGGANAKSTMAYPKMKGELEEAVKALDFEHTIILQPGLIIGEREDSRPIEFGLRKVAGVLGKVGLKDFWAQDATVIARAAVSAGLKTLEEGEKKGEKVLLLGQSDIVKLGRTEWKN